MDAIKVLFCQLDECREELVKPKRVVWINVEGALIVVTEPGQRVVGGDAWGYHVWGSKAYNIIIGSGKYPVVALDEPPTSVRRKGSWITLAFGGDPPEPWLPISVFVKGVRTPARKGVLVAVP